MKIEQIVPASIAGVELVPQAIVRKPHTYFGRHFGVSFAHGVDDFDFFDEAYLRLDNGVQFALRHYAGHPDGTTTIYLSADVADVAQITRLIEIIASSYDIGNRDIVWQRKDNPEL